MLHVYNKAHKSRIHLIKIAEEMEMMRKELVLAIFVILMLTLLATDVTQAVNPDLSVQPHLIQDETMKPLDPPLQSHPTAHQNTAPVTGPAYAHDNDQLTYSSTNISQQPYPSVYSRPTAYSGNATVTNPTYAYDLDQGSFAALAIEKTTIKHVDYAYMREFNATTFNTTLVTSVSSVDIHIKYNLNLTEWGTARKVWYGFVLYVGTRKTELQPLTETQLNVTTRIGNWTAVPEPNDGVWSKTDIGNIKIGIRTQPNMTSDIGTLRAFEVWARVYSPVVKYFDVRTFNPTGISGYSYLNVNINCSILIGGCSYKVIVSVGSANTTLQNWSDVPQIEPKVLVWERVTEPNDGWWNQTDLSNLRIVIETQIIKSENDGEFRIYEAWVTINPPTVNSYPSLYENTATVSNPTLAYDKKQMTYASISPAGTGTLTYYFAVKSFNGTTLKEYATINIQMRYNVTTWNGRWGISLYVGSKSVYLQKQITTNQTVPMLMTWVGICEPNDGVWNASDISNMQIRAEVRRNAAGGACTFREYETWVTIPEDHFTVRAHVSGIQSAAPLYGWEFNLTFNPAVLQAVIVYEGPFLKQAGLTQFSGYTINNAAGSVATGCTVDSWVYPGGGVIGSGALATITFQVIAKGNSMLNLTRVFLVTYDGVVPVDIVGFTLTPGWFQYLAGDVNGDAIVNAFDLYRLGRAYGKTTGIPGYDIDADQDKDGNVDRDDLITVRSHYGDT